VDAGAETALVVEAAPVADAGVVEPAP
jgi:hypothetical protein